MKRRRGCLQVLFVLLVAAILAVGLWYYGNNVIDTEVLELPSARLPAAFDGFRIAVVSDVHGKLFGDDGEGLVDAVAAARPDLIAITGDLCDEDHDPRQMAELAGRLAELAPTYYVSGNHEWVMDDPRGFFALLEAQGVTVLHNAYYRLELGGETIVLAGVDDPNGPYDQKTPEQLVAEIRDACGDAYILMLAHRNDRLDQWAELGVDTVLCGHGHGGVIRLPFVGGLIGTHRELFPDYTAGVYSRGRTNMVVSRGLGNSGVDLRVLNRPHLPVIVLRQTQP